MRLNRQEAELIARKYIGLDAPLKLLGSGVHGYVFQTPSITAVKVFFYEDPYANELAAYQRLAEFSVSSICGFSVPRLISFDNEKLVIEMTTVQPPRLLDFAASRLDWEPDFSDDALEYAAAELAEIEDDRRSVILNVQLELESKYGIYHGDLNLRNLTFSD